MSHRRPPRTPLLAAILACAATGAAGCRHGHGGPSASARPDARRAAAVGLTNACAELASVICTCPAMTAPPPASAPTIDPCTAAKGESEALAFQLQVLAGDTQGQKVSPAMLKSAEDTAVTMAASCRSRLQQFRCPPPPPARAR